MALIRTVYHTQERRKNILTGPIICTDEEAWLGDAYYFWTEEHDAIYWGETFKRKTGYYQIYIAHANCANVLDTVFNEVQYNFWRKQIEKAAAAITKKTGRIPTIKEINTYFKERANWIDVDGILFQDVPAKQNHSLVKGFFYKKRIQLAVYNLKIISNFALHDESRC